MKKLFFALVVIFLFIATVIPLINLLKERKMKVPVTVPQNIQLTSNVFTDKTFIPDKYTCKGKNINPPLLINNQPPNTKSMVLIVDDPDAPAGTWDHWLVWAIPPDLHQIDEGSVPPNTIQGLNSFGNTKYEGPCPPLGTTHNYFFRIYALNELLDLPPGSDRVTIERAMSGKVIATGELVGLFGR